LRHDLFRLIPAHRPDDRPNSIRCSTAKSARSFSSLASRSASRSASRATCSRSIASSSISPSASSDSCRFASRASASMRFADGAPAPSASQTTPAATATHHSKHDQPRQITHHAPPFLSPPVRGPSTTPSQDFRVLTIILTLIPRSLTKTAAHPRTLPARSGALPHTRSTSSSTRPALHQTSREPEAYSPWVN
jgi:hypothetical protein